MQSLFPKNKTRKCSVCGKFVPDPLTVADEVVNGLWGLPCRYDQDYEPVLTRFRDPGDFFSWEKLILCPTCYSMYGERFKQGVPKEELLEVKE